jgi:hypothetical protein
LQVPGLGDQAGPAVGTGICGGAREIAARQRVRAPPVTRPICERNPSRKCAVLLAITFMADDGDTFSGQTRGDRQGRSVPIRQRARLHQTRVGPRSQLWTQGAGGCRRAFWVRKRLQSAGRRPAQRDGEVPQRDSLHPHRARLHRDPLGFVYTEPFWLAANPRQFPERL